MTKTAMFRCFSSLLKRSIRDWAQFSNLADRDLHNDLSLRQIRQVFAQPMGEEVTRLGEVYPQLTSEITPWRGSAFNFIYFKRCYSI